MTHLIYLQLKTEHYRFSFPSTFPLFVSTSVSTLTTAFCWNPTKNSLYSSFTKAIQQLPRLNPICTLSAKRMKDSEVNNHRMVSVQVCTAFGGTIVLQLSLVQQQDFIVRRKRKEEGTVEFSRCAAKLRLHSPMSLRMDYWWVTPRPI